MFCSKSNDKVRKRATEMDFFYLITPSKQECADGGWGRRHAPNLFKFAIKLIKKSVSHAAGELATVYSVTFFSNNSWSIGQNAPSPKERCLGKLLHQSTLQHNLYYSHKFLYKMPLFSLHNCRFLLVRVPLNARAPECACP